MAETIKLWTMQSYYAVQAMNKGEVYQVKRRHVAEKYSGAGPSFEVAYGFFIAEASKRLPPPPGAESPIWLYRDRRWADSGPGGTLLEVDAPAEAVIQFDLRSWNRVLNLEYLARDAQDAGAWASQLERQGVKRPTDIMLTPYYPQLKAQVRQSWQRLFEGDPPPEEYAQAALWELRPEWVRILPPEGQGPGEG